MTSVLYISYTGLLDPLGQSQVLQYVLALSRRGHRMTVMSFEKPDALNDEVRVAAMQAQCAAAGVDWRPRVWHNKPIGILATLYDLASGCRHGTKIAREVGAQVIHCRSYIAGLMGLRIKRATGAKFVFDMRGFWPDERVDGGIWAASSLIYKVFKRVERLLLLQSDHVISLTKAGVREYESFPYLENQKPKSTVIPTCTNLELFQVQDASNDGFTLGYVGSVGSWYLFSDVAKVVARAFELRPDMRFLVVSKGSHDLVRSALRDAGVDLNRVELRSVNFSEMGGQIARMDAGVFFIKPAWSKRASCPTRMGEFLACGKPMLTNGGVGDVAEDLDQTGTGIALPAVGLTGVDFTDLDTALVQLFDMTTDPEMVARCRTAAETRFSLEAGVQAYSNVYDQLASDRV